MHIIIIGCDFGGWIMMVVDVELISKGMGFSVLSANIHVPREWVCGLLGVSVTSYPKGIKCCK